MNLWSSYKIITTIIVIITITIISLYDCYNFSTHESTTIPTFWGQMCDSRLSCHVVCFTWCHIRSTSSQITFFLYSFKSWRSDWGKLRHAVSPQIGDRDWEIVLHKFVAPTFPNYAVGTENYIFGKHALSPRKLYWNWLAMCLSRACLRCKVSGINHLSHPKFRTTINILFWPGLSWL